MLNINLSSILSALAILAVASGEQGTLGAKFYKDECYGPVLGSATGGTGAFGSCRNYPDGAHFVQSSDGCENGHNMYITYFPGFSCGRQEDGTRIRVGDGCYNINVGFGPKSYTMTCKVG
ncbi:hypothetical protein NQ176_g7142 [Zarea fungicola]|uniref:Uncharacterized protein n=1 Tax=Zarea fungicola TaxID=93591 RepID=A0ACC1MZQ0_9HYPO|nr:hypothetical protein NQ176_g7142 [Lecanicillium fungicola]